MYGHLKDDWHAKDRLLITGAFIFDVTSEYICCKT